MNNNKGYKQMMKVYFNDGSEAYKGFIGVGTKLPENLIHIKNVHSDRKANMIIDNFIYYLLLF